MEFKKITAGKKIPQEINVLIEIPQGSSVKYELNKEAGLMEVDRFIHSASVYPYNYGFIPHSLSEDGDPLDVLVISSQPVESGVIIRSRPVGLLQMEDEKGIDTKIIAVPIESVDPFFVHIQDIEDIDKATKDRIKFFFMRYKELDKNRWTKVRNFENKEAAFLEIKRSITRLKKAKKK
ncbi:MAG: inorganic diphosphatase [Patescibacteria group bacterium]|jgi:inorganic pyrophosphatase